MKIEIPENVRNYAKMAYDSAQSNIEEDFAIKIANLREKLGSQGLSSSSVMNRETAQLHAERIKLLVVANANALIDGYGVYGNFDEHAAKSILEGISVHYETLIKKLISDIANQAKNEAWRSRSNATQRIEHVQEFGRQVRRYSETVLNEMGCEIERKRVVPKLSVQTDATSTNARLAKPIPVRPPLAYVYHPEIQRVSQDLCEEGNFRQAVLDAFIHVIHIVREKTNLPYDGDNLMNRAFSPDGQIPPVRFNRFQTEGERNEQRGIWYLFKGIVGLRNFKAHVVATFDDPQRAHEYLALASLLLRLLDSATIDSPPSSTSSN